MKKFTLLLTVLFLLSALAACSQSGGGASADVPVEDILQGIRDAYGEDYLPSMEVTPEMMENLYGLSPDLYVEAVGETPLMSTHPDTVLVVKAAPGQGDQVEQVFNDLRDRRINDEMQYPMNIPKVNAAQVVREGDYVAFLLVGAAPGPDLETEGEAAAFAQAEVGKGVDAFRAAFE